MSKNKESKQIITAIDEQIQEVGVSEKELEELQLDQIKFSSFTPEITKKLESLSNLNFLTLNDCGLTSLENFPKLKNLVRLELIDNKLTGDSLKHLKDLPELQFLFLNGNKINKITEISQLKEFKKLFHLDLSENDITNEKNYRDDLFKLIPSLEILDNFDKEGKEVNFEDEEDDLQESGDEVEDGEEDEEDYLDEDDEDDQFNPDGISNNYKQVRG